MIDVAILDVVERLQENKERFMLPALGPSAFQISGISNAKLWPGENVGSGTGVGAVLKTASTSVIFPNADRTKFWVGSYNISPYKPVLLDLANETIAFDDATARGLTAFAFDNLGTVWATGTQNGYYGLYRRSAASVWTQVVTDTNVGQMYWRPTDAAYFFKSYSGNWYQLANGNATLVVAQNELEMVTVSAANLNSSISSNRAWREDSPSFEFSQAFQRGQAPQVADSSCTLYTGLAQDPTQDLLLASNLGFPINYTYQAKIDDIYSLIAFSSSNGTVRSHMTLAIFNKASNIVRYIGAVPALSFLTGAASTMNADHMRPFCAKWVDAGLRIWWVGATQAASVTIGDSTNAYGVMRIDIPYQPNF